MTVFMILNYGRKRKKTLHHGTLTIIACLWKRVQNSYKCNVCNARFAQSPVDFLWRSS
jgi:hypothetical protein